MSYQEERPQEKVGMSSTTKWILGIVGALIVGAGLVIAGLFVGQGLAARQAANTTVYGPIGGRGAIGGPGMMGQFYGQDDDEDVPYIGGPGTMMDRRGTRGGAYLDDDGVYPCGVMGPGVGQGCTGTLAADVDPLTVDEAEKAIDGYLDAVGDDDLELREVMIFDNHAYGQIVEESTGIGAMEVLVDPVTQTVYPEHGPNMMWNTKYGHHAGGYTGMMGGRGMRGPGYTWEYVPDVDAELSVDEEEAVEAAQSYLDAYLPGAQADEHADPFYGYYTLHVLRDGEVTGMLSVNGYTGEVWLHTWHGDFIEMAGH
jgi:hypothetical protein